MAVFAQEFDKIETEKGSFTIHFVKHASLYFDVNNQYVIHIDPVAAFGDYNKMPKADFILITHEHSDHFDIEAIKKLLKDTTIIVCNPNVFEILKKSDVQAKTIMLKNDSSADAGFGNIKAVAAYNTTNTQFHPKGRDNGYLFNLLGKEVYIAGDCENMPEMKTFGHIDIAFMPVNQPYTMTVEQAADAVAMIKPVIFYPYHYGQTDIKTDINRLIELLKPEKNTEIRIRNME